MSLCTQLWRGCFCTKTRRARPTQLLLPAGNLDIIHFATFFYFDRFSLYVCIPLPFVMFFHSPSLLLGLRLLCSFRFSAVVVFPFFSLTSPRRKGNFLFTWMFIQSSERAILPTRNPTLLNKFLVLFQATVIHPVPARCTSFPFSTFAICIDKDNFWSCFL